MINSSINLPHLVGTNCASVLFFCLLLAAIYPAVRPLPDVCVSVAFVGFIFEVHSGVDLYLFPAASSAHSHALRLKEMSPPPDARIRVL